MRRHHTIMGPSRARRRAFSRNGRARLPGNWRLVTKLVLPTLTDHRFRSLSVVGVMRDWKDLHACIHGLMTACDLLFERRSTSTHALEIYRTTYLAYYDPIL